MIEKLKEAIERVNTHKIRSQKDCKILSVKILEQTGAYLSPATLRRVFGFLSTNSNPSRVTLDILSRFAGFDSWETFVNEHKGSAGSQNQIKSTWDRMIERSRSIGEHTLGHVGRKSGIDFKSTIHRSFTDERFAFFLRSNLSATALVGPGGYGKSTLLAHWYEKNYLKKKYSNDILLFISSQVLDSYGNADVYFENWLTRLLGADIEHGVFTTSRPIGEPPGKLILIIDALDESGLQGTKLEKLYTSLVSFVKRFSEYSWFKLIVSARKSTWDSFRNYLAGNDAAWYYTDLSLFSVDGANIPPLTSFEIQAILNNTINRRFPRRVLVDEMGYGLRETLAYPYLLQLFIRLYSPNEEFMLTDRFELIREFLKRQVYRSRFSDEKVDILNKIIELSAFGASPNNVKKSALKEAYPIHLKLAGNYFEAYEDLISYGILTEEQSDGYYGGITKIVRISNIHLFEVIVTLSLLHEDTELTFELFKDVENRFQGHEMLSPIICLLYRLAYKDRRVEPLQRIFELNTETLHILFESSTIALSLRKDEYLRKLLLPLYAEHPLSRKYLFESNPDIDYLVKTSSKNLEYFLLSTKKADEHFYADTLITYAGFLSLDYGLVERHFRKIAACTPSIKNGAEVGGWFFACKFLHNYLVDSTDPSDTLQEALHLFGKFADLNDGSHLKFAKNLLPAFTLGNSSYLISHFSAKPEPAQQNSNGHYQEVKLYDDFARLLSGSDIKLEVVVAIERMYGQLNPLDNFHSKVLGEALRSSYFVNNNELTKAYECYRNATELCTIAGYKLFEVKLMKSLSAILLRFDETAKANDCLSYAEGLTRKTGFNFDLF